MDTIQYPTLIKINEMYPQMTQSQQQLATYILENPSIVVNTSITDLMSHTNFRSEASVVKFCRLLGFDGFKSFKIKLTQEYLNRTFYHSQNDITLDDTPGDIKKKVFLGAINFIIRNYRTEVSPYFRKYCVLSELNRQLYSLQLPLWKQENLPDSPEQSSDHSANTHRYRIIS